VLLGRTTPSQHRAAAVKPSLPQSPASPVAKPLHRKAPAVAAPSSTQDAGSRYPQRYRRPRNLLYRQHCPAATPIRPPAACWSASITCSGATQPTPSGKRLLPCVPLAAAPGRPGTPGKNRRSGSAVADRNRGPMPTGNRGPCRYVAGSRSSGPRPGSRCVPSNPARTAFPHLDPAAWRSGDPIGPFEQRRGPMPQARSRPRAPGRPGMLRRRFKRNCRRRQSRASALPASRPGQRPVLDKPQQEGERKLHPDASVRARPQFGRRSYRAA